MKFKVDGFPTFSLNVVQGIVHINSISILQVTPDVISLAADCKQKYPEYFGGAFNEVYLTANERTMHVDKMIKTFTRIQVHGLNQDEWNFVEPPAYCRYSVSWHYVRKPFKEFRENVLDKFQWKDKR